MKAGRAAGLLAATLLGCTFAGLVDYETPACDPDVPLEQDGCNQLNVGNTSCQRYQCDAKTRRCVLGTLDADRDGDPSIECGGTDCDDHDKRRSGRTPEVCDGIDNDCDGIVDNGVIAPSQAPLASIALVDQRLVSPDTQLSSPNGRETFVTYLGSAPFCVRGFPLGDEPVDGGACLMVNADESVDGGLARQPELLPVGVQRDSTSGVVFVEENPPPPCDKDQLAFSSRASGRATRADCGASLPALVSFPLQSEALIAFYDARVASRADPIGGCASATAALLKLRWVDRPTSDAPDLSTSAASTLGSAISTRPPALLALEGGTSVVLASPFETSAGVWTLTPDGRVIPLATSIPALEGARSVAAAIGSEGGTTRLAIVAERGCTPSQTITMVLAPFDVLASAFVSSDGKPQFREVTLQTPATIATAPSITWVAGQKEWWVTWIDERKKAMLRRVSADGSHADVGVEIGDARAVSVRAPSGSVFTGDAGVAQSLGQTRAFLLRSDGSAIDELAFACK